MLFRTSEGKLIEIKKCDFKNDTLYYQKLLDIKKRVRLLEYFQLQSLSLRKLCFVRII